MKKLTIIVIAVIGISTAAVAQDGVEMGVGTDLVASLTTPYISPEASITYRSGVFGFGGGAKAYWGPVYGELYAAPYVRAWLGSFYLGGGIVAEILPPRELPGEVAFTISSSDLTVSPLATLGFEFKLFDAGSGVVKLDVGLEGFISTTYVDDPEGLGESIGFIAVAPIAVALNIPKVNLGLTYALGL